MVISQIERRREPMRKPFLHAAAAAALAGALALPAAAQTAAKPMDAPQHGSAMAALPDAGTVIAGARRSIAYQLGEAQKKLLALAQAMPADKYSWRPGPGVRSVGEVFMHVAGSNYFIASMWGATPPAGVHPQDLEKDGADKAKVIAALQQSFDWVNQAMAALPDADLHRQIQVFGHPARVADLFLGITTHAHEHLGQSIAYARMNGVVPPWSEEQQQMMKKMQDQAKPPGR
jgi:uncharacterized damage-inducible protein DinB